jgi:hypothetical protein
MTEPRVQNNLEFEDVERGMLLQPRPGQNLTRSVAIRFLPQTVYRLSFDNGPRNVANAGDVN